MTYDVVLFTDMSSKIYHVRPLGAYRIASELRSNGHSVIVVDYFSKWLAAPDMLFALLKTIIGKNTIFVGYSGTFFSKKHSDVVEPTTFNEYWTMGSMPGDWPVNKNIIRAFNAKIKKINNNTKILLGGTVAAHSNFVDSGIDYVVRGFSDSVIVNLTKALQAQKTIKFEFLNGLKIVSSQFYHSDHFLFPTSTTEYTDIDCLTPSNTLPLETSRGCMFKCSFCDFPMIGRKKGHPDYLKHPEVVRNEILRNYEQYGITQYSIVDDTFNESTDKLRLLLDAIQKTNIKINFSAYIRLDLLVRFPEQIELLKELGIQSAFMGIETLNPQSARAINKPSNIEKVLTSLVDVRKSWDKVAIFGSFIAGLPHETEETISSWADWVFSNPDLIDGYIIGTLSLRHEVTMSDIRQHPEKYGYSVSDHGAHWVSNTGLTRSDAAQISNKLMNVAWDAKRLMVSGWDLLGIQSQGIPFSKLFKTPLNDIPFLAIQEKTQQEFQHYSKKLLSL